MKVQVRQGRRPVRTFDRVIEVVNPLVDWPVSPDRTILLLNDRRFRPSYNTRLIRYYDQDDRLCEFICSQHEIVRVEQPKPKPKRRWLRR